MWSFNPAKRKPNRPGRPSNGQKMPQGSCSPCLQGLGKKQWGTSCWTMGKLYVHRGCPSVKPAVQVGWEILVTREVFKQRAGGIGVKGSTALVGEVSLLGSERPIYYHTSSMISWQTVASEELRNIPTHIGSLLLLTAAIRANPPLTAHAETALLALFYHLPWWSQTQGRLLQEQWEFTAVKLRSEDQPHHSYLLSKHYLAQQSDTTIKRCSEYSALCVTWTQVLKNVGLGSLRVTWSN